MEGGENAGVRRRGEMCAKESSRSTATWESRWSSGATERQAAGVCGWGVRDDVGLSEVVGGALDDCYPEARKDLPLARWISKRGA